MIGSGYILDNITASRRQGHLDRSMVWTNMGNDVEPARVPAVQRVASALLAVGVASKIVEFAESTRTAEDAARAIGTDIARIVKSLVFIAGELPLLVLVSGVNRVAVDRLGA